MELLAGSLNVEVDDFLHSGYVSAYPRSFASMGDYKLEQGTAEVIDVKAALALKTPADKADQVADASTTAASSQAPPLMPAMVTISELHTGFTLAIVFFFFTFLVSLYYRRIRKVQRPGWRPWLLTGLPMVLLVVFYYGVFPLGQELCLNNLPAPWKGVPVRQYEDPETATQAILHGLVAHAMPGCPVKARSLAAIQGEVAFPVPADQYTPGMEYAVKTYGRDGWGREFSFEALRDGQYHIASAGADGTHGTEDDVVFVTHVRRGADWEQLVNGVYVRRVEGEYAYFIHRVEHGHFRWANGAAALNATGTNLFDLLYFDEWSRYHTSEEGPHPILARLEEHPGFAQPDKKAELLFFVQIRDADDG